jgi:uncharacterized delta-60 repeat protein
MKRILKPTVGCLLLASASLVAQTPGSLDTNFVPATAYSDLFLGLAIQPDGKILVSGREGLTYGVIYRLNTNGSVDPGFYSGARATCLDATIPQINTLSLQTNGSIILGGAFTYVDTSIRARLARLNSAGLLDSTFTPSAGNSVLASAVQPDGRIIVGGSFSNFRGSGKNYLGRLNPDGSLDSTFNPQGTGPTAKVSAVALDADGTIVIGGDFTSVNGFARPYVARLLPDGTVDPGFDPTNAAPNDFVSAVAIQSDHKVVIGGGFTQVGGTNRGRIALLNQDGTLNSTFAPSSGCENYYVWAVAVQTNGKILAGGRFSMVNGQARAKIACFDTNGVLDAAFDPNAGSGAGSSDEIRALKLQADGKIVVAGRFTTFSGQSLYGVARLHGEPGGVSPPAQPRLDYDSSPGGIFFSWTGSFSLQRATDASGPYTDVPGGGTSPCTVPMSQPAEFFRLLSAINSVQVSH